MNPYLSPSRWTCSDGGGCLPSRRRGGRLPRGRPARAGCVAVALGWVLLVVPGVARSQIDDFGKNKVQYADLDWRVMKSEHFDLHFYPEEEDLALVAVALAESSYATLAVQFRHEIPERVPLVLYSAHAYFEQTHIIPQFLPEGVGGFTDFMRSRVALPFTGSFGDFRRILQHELVHAFQYSYLDRVYRLHPRSTYLIPPLWFMEGLAEYLSRPWDAEADMVLADLVIHGTLPDIPGLEALGLSFASYKVGQSLVTYIAETYGEDKIGLLWELLWTAPTFEILLEDVCGVPIEELSRQWKDSLRRTYYPTVATRQSLEEFSTPLTEGPSDLKPTPVPGTDAAYVYLSFRMGYPAVYRREVGREDEERILRTGESGKEESLHIFGSRVDVSSDGRLAVVARSGGRDALYVYDLESGRRTAGRRFAKIVAMSSPAWAPDDSAIVFSGLTEDGRSDLFVWEPDSDRLRRLTCDRFQDVDPDWSPDGRWIVFSSDRTARGGDGNKNLFLLDLETRGVFYLTAGDWNDEGPRWNEEGTEVVFASSREGRQDLYVVDREGRGRRLTHVQTWAGDPDWMSGGRGWLFTGYEKGRFRVCHVERAADTTAAMSFLEPLPGKAWEWPGGRTPGSLDVRTYRPDFGLEVAQGGVAFGPYQSLGQGFQAALSDLLGDRLLFFQVSNSARSLSQFWSRFNAGAAYVTLSGRTNWGVSAFHDSGDFLDEIGNPIFRKETGAGLFFSYPFSKFTRLESGITAMYAERENLGPGRTHGLMVANHAAWVLDTSLWLPEGPIDGSRARIGAGLTLNARDVTAEDAFVEADVRRYLRLSLESAIALRASGRMAGGRNPERAVLGGPLSLRGYDWRSVYGTRSLLLGLELRFPFVRGFALDFPLRDLRFPGVQGVLFVDAGNAWEKEEPMPRLIGSVGVGFRMGLGGFAALRLDVAKRTDFRDFDEKTVTQFFVGWNY